MQLQHLGLHAVTLCNFEVTWVFLNYGFLKVYAQQWDYWVIWQFYSQFLKESPFCSPQWLYQFTFQPTVQDGSLFFISSPTFIVCGLFDDTHSDQCGVIPDCHFDLHFSNNENVDHLFMCLLANCVFFGEMYVQVFCSCFDWLLAFLILRLMSCLYILEIIPFLSISCFIFNYFLTF